jgi:hypothetical protein
VNRYELPLANLFEKLQNEIDLGEGELSERKQRESPWQRPMLEQLSVSIYGNQHRITIRGTGVRWLKSWLMNPGQGD